MPLTPSAALESYLTAIRTFSGTEDASAELSYYTALSGLLQAVGDTLDPRVIFMAQPKGRDDARPDGGFYTADQISTGDAEELGGLLASRKPGRGVVEVKGFDDDAFEVAGSRQVRKYWSKYQQVLVTNYREFVLVGRGPDGKQAILESHRLAPSAGEFKKLLRHPRQAGGAHGEALVEFLRRALLHAAPITTPLDLAATLAGYAKQARERIATSNLPALRNVRTALESALGVEFDTEKGDAFFRSTLIQTLWYGAFSAWVLWSREQDPDDRIARFQWRQAAWSLRVPIIRALFEQVGTRTALGPLNIVPLLDWTEDALNRVDRRAFFAAFSSGNAVQYFYEPFLEAFDPDLREAMGVWYTPHEIVEYQVARVDRALREELGVAAGLASPDVYVLDPCCGTGAYLVETLRVIAEKLSKTSAPALLGARVKEAATRRVMGFELLPAPFVVAHLQLGLLLQSLGAPLAGEGAEGSETGAERAAVFLTNALTGWEPETGPKQHLLFSELEAERDAAQAVKHSAPILVILGNPPYYAYAGVAVKEERSLTTAYRTTRHAPAPAGHGLNDLYVRFFRMAERRIVERTGRGVVCYISNYSWLTKASFPGMRERYLEVFDRIWIDNLHGAARENFKLTPDGAPDPSVFSTEHNPEGIQLGTAIALLVRKSDHQENDTVRYREFWGRTKRADLLAAKDTDGVTDYQELRPVLELGLPFAPASVGSDYLEWPLLTDLFPTFVPGVQTKRDDLVIDVDRARLEGRMRDYFDATVSDARIAEICPRAMKTTMAFDAVASRTSLVARGMLPDAIVRHVYRPFDVRWLYYETATKLLERRSPSYPQHVFPGNVALVTQQRARRAWSPPQVIESLGALHLVESSASIFPMRLHAAAISEEAQASLFAHEDDVSPTVPARTPPAETWRWNLSEQAATYLTGLGVEDSASHLLFEHAVAVLHSAAYSGSHQDALRRDWARLPLPSDAETLRQSARLGEIVAALVNPEQDVPGVTTAAPGEELVGVAVVSTTSGRQVNPGAGHLAVTAPWGIFGKDDAVMPGPGRVVVRPFSDEEWEQLSLSGLDNETLRASLGTETIDVYLNDDVFLRNVPIRVWDYDLGGYQVLRKYLSYRQRTILGRALTLDEVEEVTHIVRRMTALLLLQPHLDANYLAVALGPQRLGVPVAGVGAGAAGAGDAM